MNKTVTVIGNEIKVEILLIKKGHSLCVIEGSAKCNPEDKFDYEFGVKLATIRAFKKYKREQMINLNKELVEAMARVDMLNKLHDKKEKAYLKLLKQHEEMLGE